MKTNEILREACAIAIKKSTSKLRVSLALLSRFLISVEAIYNIKPDTPDVNIMVGADESFELTLLSKDRKVVIHLDPMNLWYMSSVLRTPKVELFELDESMTSMELAAHVWHHGLTLIPNRSFEHLFANREDVGATPASSYLADI